MAERLRIAFRIGADGPVQHLAGRDAWALLELVKAGAKGVTPIDVPGPRWSAYVHTLRRLGIAVETVHERHAGPFPGTHARYVLRAPVTVLKPEGIAA